MWCDPLEIEHTHKKDDVSSWPKIHLGNIFEYILTTRDFKKDYIGRYKDQKAYSYFDSGFVGEILLYKKNKNVVVLFCNLRGSMVINNEKKINCI